MSCHDGLSVSCDDGWSDLICHMTMGGVTK